MCSSMLTHMHYCCIYRCCQGRIVSALEGGYRIHGENVSAFARSVAAHVCALMEDNSQKWDEMETQVMLSFAAVF